MSGSGTEQGAGQREPSAAPVFPVGHGAGLFVPAEQSPAPSPIESEPPSAAAHHVVRVGRTPEHLTEAGFGTWMLAHRPEQPGGASWTVADLVAAGHRAGLPDVEHQVGDLLRRGILVEVTDPISFAHGYRIAPLFLGLGNRPDDLDSFGIGVPGLEPLATVGPVAFELWQWGWVAPSLWAHCEVLATIAEQEAEQNSDGGRREVSRSADDQLGLVMHTLPSLLAGFVAFLEPLTTPQPLRRPSATSAGR